MTAALYDARHCILGEGPFWHPEREQFFWFDIIGNRLLSRLGDEPLEWRFGEHASAAGWIDADSLLVATESGLRRLHLADGSHEPLAAIEADNPATRSNDGRADPQGGFWIGTMGKAQERGLGCIYRYYRGVVEPLYRGISIPNAICFAPGGRLAYFADTPTRRIMAQPLDAAGWPDGPAEVFVDLAAEKLNPDGAVVDAEGGLWNAQWGAARVARYTPDGRFDRAVAVPGRHASCPAFGGPGLTQMLVTTAREGMADPDADQGRTYLADAGVAGQAEHRVVPGRS